ALRSRRGDRLAREGGRPRGPPRGSVQGDAGVSVPARDPRRGAGGRGRRLGALLAKILRPDDAVDVVAGARVVLADLLPGRGEPGHARAALPQRGCRGDPGLVRAGGEHPRPGGPRVPGEAAHSREGTALPRAALALQAPRAGGAGAEVTGRARRG